MDPDLERRLTEEVIYLHSLWQQGPPGNPNPNYPATAETDFRKKRLRSRQLRKINNDKRIKSNLDSGPEWPCPEPLKNEPSASSGWPSIQPGSTTVAARPLTSQERENLVFSQLQYKEFESCRKFFSRNADSGSDEAEGNDDDDDDNDDDNVLEESEEYKYFLELFMENNELRDYYERNSEDGLFFCLVCGGGIRKKSAKRKFKSCVGLVQHSIGISKTPKRRAHKAFGQVICRVFGWDIDRLPTIVLKGEPLGRSLVDSGNSEVQPEVNVEGNGHSGVRIENGVSLDDNDSQKNEGIFTGGDENMNSVDENEHGLEKERTSEVIDCNNVKDLISGEVLQSILEACKEFFAGPCSSNDDDSRADNLKDGNGLEKYEEYKFFVKLFTENEKLRRYYENRHENGEFCCLVCEGSGNKDVKKRFKTCASLLQHSAMTKSKKKLAHKVYSLVICRVVGYDFEKLPAIVLKGEPLGHSLTQSGATKKDESVANLTDSDVLVENNSQKVNNGEAVVKDGPQNS